MLTPRTRHVITKENLAQIAAALAAGQVLEVVPEAPTGYTRQFQHTDWIDFVDPVQAGGDNGFNERFHALESEFDLIAAAISSTDASIAQIEATPPAIGLTVASSISNGAQIPIPAGFAASETMFFAFVKWYDVTIPSPVRMSGSASSPRIQAWSQRSFSPSIARPPANRSLRPASQSPKEEAGEMIIVYNSNTGEIVGHCSRVFDSGKWREATIDELFPDHAKSGFAAVHFADDARYLAYRPHHWRLRRDESGVVTGIERLPMLSLTCDASDSDSDGIPDLPADSASIAHVTAKTSDDADVDITFRTTRGSLGQRTVHTTKGSAAVELRAAGETVAVTVTATAPGYRPGNLQMEFVPAQTTRAKRD